MSGPEASRDGVGPPALTLRRPTVEDGVRIWALAKDSEPLELNPLRTYFLLCKHFPETCVVAEQGGEIVGFVAAYRPPVLLGAVFVWQVAVQRAFRGRGVASAMLVDLLQTATCRTMVHYLEAAVCPDNLAALALFRSLARRLETRCEETPLFIFGEGGRQEEVLFIVGPFRLPVAFSAR